MRPHLAPLDGFHHARTEQAVCQSGVMHRHHPRGKPGDGEDRQGHQRLWERFAKNPGIGLAIEAHNATRFRFVAVVDEIMAASQKLI